ncbi:MAG: hypothetical protein U0791_13080 [Gemmataceae bacterium]
MNDDLRPEYDLSQLKGGVRGKYAQRFAKQGLEKTAGGTSEIERNRFLQHAVAAMMPVLQASVVPLLVKEQGRLHQLGTGTLFQVADSRFLVTAEHVVQDAARLKLRLLTFDNTDQGQAIPIPCDFETYSDPADVAIARLDEAFVHSAPNRRYLSVHQADRLNRRPPNGIFLIHGYPEVGLEEHPDHRLSIGAYTAATGLFEGAAPEDTDPKWHLLLTNSPNGFDLGTGAAVESPKCLRGISGCSVWQLHYDGLSFEHWSPNDTAIVAVQTGVYDQGIIKATRWSLIDRLLRESHPDLAGPLSLAVPDTRSPHLLSAV